MGDKYKYSIMRNYQTQRYYWIISDIRGVTICESKRDFATKVSAKRSLVHFLESIGSKKEKLEEI